jgi:hypothetical protein
MALLARPVLPHASVPGSARDLPANRNGATGFA